MDPGASLQQERQAYRRGHKGLGCCRGRDSAAGCVGGQRGGSQGLGDLRKARAFHSISDEKSRKNLKQSVMWPD